MEYEESLFINEVWESLTVPIVRDVFDNSSLVKHKRRIYQQKSNTFFFCHIWCMYRHIEFAVELVGESSRLELHFHANGYVRLVASPYFYDRDKQLSLVACAYHLFTALYSMGFSKHFDFQESDFNKYFPLDSAHDVMGVLNKSERLREIASMYEPIWERRNNFQYPLNRVSSNFWDELK